jgi:LPS sulfotransferase NodH
VHHHHAVQWFGADLREIDTWLPGLVVVRLRRRDRWAQAASWVRAVRTGRFAAGQRGYGLDWVDRASVVRASRWLDAADAGWDAALAGRVVVDVDHEDLVAAPVSVATRVLDAIGEPGSRVRAPDLAPQGDAAWRARVASLR